MQRTEIRDQEKGGDREGEKRPRLGSLLWGSHLPNPSQMVQPGVGAQGWLWDPGARGPPAAWGFHRVLELPQCHENHRATYTSCEVAEGTCLSF